MIHHIPTPAGTTLPTPPPPTIPPPTSGGDHSSGPFRQYRERESMQLYEKMCCEISQKFQAVLTKAAETMQQEQHQQHILQQQQQLQQQMQYQQYANNYNPVGSPLLQSPISPPPVQALINPAGGQSQLAIWRQAKLNQAFQQAMSPQQIVPPPQVNNRGRGRRVTPTSPIIPEVFSAPATAASVFSNMEPAWGRLLSASPQQHMVDINCNVNK